MEAAAPGFSGRAVRVSYWHVAAQRQPAPAGEQTGEAAPSYPGVVKLAIVFGGSAALWAGLAAGVRLVLG